MSFFDSIYRLLYPPRCAFCARVVGTDDDFICDSCEKVISYIENPCLSCGRPKKLCKCAGKKREYLSIVSPFVYSGLSRSAVLRLKRKPANAERLAEDIVKYVKRYYGSVKFDVVTSVPMHSNKLREKGFNHADVLARQVARLLELPYEQVLTKLYETPSQHSSTGFARLGNVKGVFDRCEGVDISAKTILLIDDVATTGATLNECALMLNLYGADAVYAAVAAIAVND